MSGDRTQLTVRERELLGSAESRRLRRQGWIPGVLYGKGSPRAIAVQERDLRGALTGRSGLHAVLDVVLDGQSTVHPSILKDYQQDPLKGRVAHVDLQEVRLDQPIQASVSVTLLGEPAGVKVGGVLNQVAAMVTVEALPMEVPEHIDADISAMEIGDTLRLADLTAPEGVTFLDDPEETVIATVAVPRVEIEEPEEAEEEAEVAEGEEVPEGAAEEAPAAEAEASGEGEPGTVEG